MEMKKRINVNLKDFVLLNLSGILGITYFVIAIIFFHDVWYHFGLAIFSSISFSHIFKEWQREREKDRFLIETDKFLENLIHYYQHFDGHIIEALRSSGERIKGELGLLAERIIEELEGVDLETGKIKLGNLLRSRASTDSFWFYGLIEILFIIKEKGRDRNNINEDMYINSLEKMSKLIKQEILNKMRNDNDNKSTEIWIMLAPLVSIPGTQLVYLVLFQNCFDILSTYKSIEAQTIASLTFSIGAIGALFVNWIRRG